MLALALAALVTGVPVWLRTAGTTALQGDLPVTVTGTQAAPGVPAAGARAALRGRGVGLAGRVGRWFVVGAVALWPGCCQVASAAAVVGDPEPVARTAVAAATGVETLAARWP